MKHELAEKLGLKREKRAYRRDPSKLKKRHSDVNARSGMAVGRVPAGVSSASCDELIAAGWGVYDRTRIPADWRTRRPGQL